PRRQALKLHGGSMAPLLAQLTSTLDSCSLIVSVRRAKKGPGKQPPGCLLLQTAAKLFETQSVCSSQITIRSSVSPPGSAARIASWRKEEKKRERKRPMVGHLSTRPAGVGSTPTESSRHLLAVCKAWLWVVCPPPPPPRGPSPRSSSPKEGLLPHGDFVIGPALVSVGVGCIPLSLIEKGAMSSLGLAGTQGFREEDDSEVPDVAKSPLTYVGVDILEDSPGSFTLYSCPRTFISPASR
ncbi:Harmonin, partial [Dissostichus eleginoides]